MARISPQEWRTLEPLIDAALELEPADQAAYILSAVPDDGSLRQRLEQLLVACRHGEQLLLAPVETFAPLLQVPDVLGGRYRILRELGHGGMATVYLADDPNNRRQVAVKILDIAVAHVLGNARFAQEIEVVARLQHPHILPLFDSGEAEGLRYYVMPHVEGESLRQYLRRESPLPIEEAIRIATEVADALDFAHRHGVVHRDIKPENILVHEGRSQVADFGIALAVTGSTVHDEGRERGIVLGTPRYMSPEQAKGAGEVSGRSDIYSLGIVLYEMLAGEPPRVSVSGADHEGGGTAHSVPALTRLRKSVPPNVAAAVARAMEPLPADRFRTARDFAAALADSGFRHGVPAAGPTLRWKSLAVALASVAVVGAVLGTRRFLPIAAPLPVARFDVTPARGQAMIQGLPGVEFTISRDGSRIVYVGESPTGGTQLWLRELNSIDAREIPGSTGALDPILSPDGATVAFNNGRGIRTLSLSGGAARQVVEEGRSPAWGADGALYFARNNIIFQVPPSGGTPLPFTQAAEGSQDFPHELPNGRGIVFTVRYGLPGRSRIAVAGPAGGPIREILTGTMARYSTSGHLVWSNARGTLMAAPFDLKQLAIVGPEVPVLEGVKIKTGAASQFAISESGAVLYQTVSEERKELVWVSRDGGTEPFDSTWSGGFSGPALSPDGTQLAVAVRGAMTSEIWIASLTGAPRTKLALESRINSTPSWSPDGRFIAFGSDSAASNSWTIRTRRVDGRSPGPAGDRLVSSGTDPRWSTDGRWLVYRLGFFNADIMGFRPGVDTVPVAVVASKFGERNPTISPDGRWLAYTSNETHRDEVYVRPFPNTGSAKWVVSTTGGIEPVWSRSGRELFYRNAQHQLVSAAIEASPSFSVTARTVLFSDVGMLSSALHPEYDVTQDARRFIMVRQKRGSATGTLILVQNLFDELRRGASRDSEGRRAPP